MLHQTGGLHRGHHIGTVQNKLVEGAIGHVTRHARQCQGRYIVCGSGLVVTHSSYYRPPRDTLPNQNGAPNQITKAIEWYRRNEPDRRNDRTWPGVAPVLAASSWLTGVRATLNTIENRHQTILLHSVISTMYTVVKVVFGIGREYDNIRSWSL